MSRIRTYILLCLLLFLSGTASGQNPFTGIFLSDNKEASVFISKNDTLFIDGSAVNENSEDLNIYNSGVLILTDSLVNRAGALFERSSKGVGTGGQDVDIMGNVVFAGNKKQIIRGNIFFADLSIRDSVELKSDIHVAGRLRLNQWSEPGRLILGRNTLKMYINDNFDRTAAGILEGEDEDHYVTSDSEFGNIRMMKDHTGEGRSALATMGLQVNVPDDNGHITVERYHIPESNAALGGIRKYYSITDNSGAISGLSIRYLTHDLLPEHSDQASLRLFYSEDGIGESYQLIESESLNSTVSSGSGGVKSNIEKPFRYTVAATCRLPGLTLGADRELCLNSSVTIAPQWVSQPAYSYDYVWNDDEATREEKTAATPKTFLLKGDTVIWVKATDTRGCSAFDTVVIRALPVPVAQIAPIHVENSRRCISETWTFETTPENGHSYQWDFRDHTTATGATVTKDYTLPGDYRVRLAVENEHLCTAADSVRITVEGMPVPDFTTQIVAEKKIRLIDQSQFFTGTRQYEWKVLDQTFTAATAEVLFPDFGEYEVILTVKGDKCAATASQTISVTEKGSLGFRIDNASFCQGAALQFTNESVCLWGSMTFEWDFGDGTRSTLANPVKTYHDDETAVYTVTLRAIDPETGWSSALARDITVHRPPRINWGGAISTCDSHWLLQPEEEGYTYLWSNGAVSSAVDVTRSGRYSLRLTDVNGCRTVEDADITLNSAVMPAISDTQSCGDVILDAGNPGSAYVWSNGAATRTLTVDRSGTYSVTVTQPNGCTGSKTVSVEIRQRPEVKVNGPADLCEGSSATLYTAQEAGTVYHWNTGAASPAVDITGEGWYRVTAVNTASSCSASDSLYVVGLAAPVIDLGRDRNVCLGQETILTMDDYYYAAAVEWWKDGGQVYNARNFAVSDTGTYNLRVTLANGCSAVDRIHFGGIATALNIDFLSASQANVGDTLVFIDLSYPDPIAWNWEISSGFRTDQPVFQYAFWNEGVYSVKLSVDNGGCILSETKTVTVTSRLKQGGDTGGGQGGEETPVDDTRLKPLYVAPSSILEASAIPNPSDGDFYLKARLGQPSRLIARLYTPTGQAVASFIIPQQSEDVLYECNFTSLPAGVYILQLLSDNDVKTVKIVINK
jgi:PKD repeat protein